MQKNRLAQMRSHLEVERAYQGQVMSLCWSDGTPKTETEMAVQSLLLDIKSLREEIQDLKANYKELEAKYKATGNELAALHIKLEQLSN